MPKADDSQLLQKALALHQRGDLNGAANLYRQLITTTPNHAYALHFLGIAEAGVGHLQQAKQLMARSLSLEPLNIKFVENYATILFQSRDYRSAIQACREGLTLDHKNPSLRYVSAASLFKLNQLHESLRQFDAFLSLQPTHIAAHNERGSVLAEMKQYDAALASFDQALSLNPKYAEAHLNKGNLYGVLERHDEAFAAYDKALALKPDLADAWLGRGNALRHLKRFDEAFAAYDKALALKPDLADAWLGRGNVFHELKRYDEAFAAYDKALEIRPDLAEAWLGRGNVLYDLKRSDDATAAYDNALALNPNLAEGWAGRGNALDSLKRVADALAAYDKALALKPDLVGLEGSRINSKMQLCDWSNFDNERSHLLLSVRRRKPNTPPFPLLAIPSSVEDQLQCAKSWIADKYPATETPIWRGERYDHDRIRLAYLSADFRQHAVSSVIAGVFECQDRSRFEVTAISFGPDDHSEMRRRLEASFGTHFIDVTAWSDHRVADLIRQAEIDILVDLMGHTKDSRPSIFARRPAPIQVSYLGYLATMGADYIDYIIADKIVIPDTQRGCYAEKVVELPNTFQPADRERRISDKKVTRAAVGLPEDAFVFCCFNSSYKITPDVFDVWMRLLKKVDGSVLWLTAASPAVTENLRNEAAKRGVGAERLIFAPIVPLPEHQARLGLADLFLDTLPYNAGATASDTLWAGLPVLTRSGDTFVGRMAASVLNAVGLPELITTTAEAYEALAIDLAIDRRKLEAIKQKLAKNRLMTPLFDTKLYTQHLEAAFAAMYRRRQAGLAPDHIVIAG